MPAFYMDATLYTLDDNQFKKFVDKWQEEIMRGGVRQFLRACLKVIPSRTGFLRGSFTEIRRHFAKGTAGGAGGGEHELLGAIFGQGGTRRRVNPQADDPVAREARIRALMKQHSKYASKGRKKTSKKKAVKKEYYRASSGGKKTKILKTSTSGIQFATKPDDVLKFSGNVATFFLDIAISYYRINDFYSRIRGAPWRSMMEGGSAFTNWLGRAADLFPQIAEILVKQKIGLRGSRLTQTKLPQEQVAYRFVKIRHESLAPIPKGPPPKPDPPRDKHEFQRNRLKAEREARSRQGQQPRWRWPEKKQKE